MKKSLLALTVLFAAANMVFAEVTVEQARSAEYLRNEGYSDPLIQAVQKEAGEYNVKPTNKWQKVGFRFWNYVDPASPKARDEESHNIQMYPKYSDL